MNDSPTSSNQSAAPHGSSILRVQIPDVAKHTSRQDYESTATIAERNTNQINSLQQAISAPTPTSMQTISALAQPTLTPASAEDLQHLPSQSAPTGLKKVDSLIDSILKRFPLSQPTTLVFVGSLTDVQTDKVTADVAQRITERRIGKVLLVDSNPNSLTLSSNLQLDKSAGIGNIICDDQPWQNLLQAGSINGLDFLPYGTVNTAKTLRSRTTDFLNSSKEFYQFICVSVGLNDTAISKSFCNAADGIYLLVDLNQISHFQAKAAADKFKLNNQPLVGCIALDADQESQ